MAIHTIAYGMSVLAAGVLQALDPVPDATVTENGKMVYVPAKYNKVVAVGALSTSGALTQAQLHAPSLREMYFVDIAPLLIASTLGGSQSVENLFVNPLGLETNEGLEFFSDGGGLAAVAADVYGLLWLSDGAVTPAKGKHYKLRATSAIAQAPLAWTNGGLTFAQTLPVGTYQIIGLRAMSADLIAARLVYIGAAAVTKPGVPGVADMQSVVPAGFGVGDLGILGQFESTNPPSIDVLGGVSASQTYEFDLIKTA